MNDISTKRHLVIVRTGGSVIDLTSYNCQELGLAKVLTLKGWKVTIILAGLRNDVKYIKVGQAVVAVYYAKFRKLNQALAWFQGIESLLSSLNPDNIQIHEFGMLMSYRVLRWGMKYNIPVYLIQGSYQTTQKPIFKQLEMVFNKTFGSYILKYVSGVGCKSLMAEKYVKKYMNKQCHLTYIGLDTEKFEHRIDEDWKGKLGIDMEKKVLLYVGILEQRRNPLFLLQILASLPQEYVLIMVGDGPQELLIKEQVAAQKLSNRCFMLGKLTQEQLPCLYECSDLFLLASDYEIYGMVLLESMYFGVPVISTRNAGSEVIINQDVDGCIITNKRVAEWKYNIQRICENDDCMRSMKKMAASKIMKTFVWPKAADEFMKLYK